MLIFKRIVQFVTFAFPVWALTASVLAISAASVYVVWRESHDVWSWPDHALYGIDAGGR